MPWYILFWLWLKKNWKSVLLGVSTLGVGLLIGKAFGRRSGVTSSEFVEHKEVKRRVVTERDKKIDRVEQQRDERIAEIKEKHEQTVKNLTDKQRSQVKQLEQDPEALNEYLFQVGKSIRGS